MLFEKFKRMSGIDFHVFFVLLMRFWGVIAGAVMVLFVPQWLSPLEQGVYYTFSSIIGMQVFFELGFNTVLLQMVSHEMAWLKFDVNKGVAGEDVKKERLFAIVRFSLRWYFVIAFFYFFIMLIFGLLFIDKPALRDLPWKDVWVVLLVCVTANLFISPFLTVLEAMGLVGQVARLRLFQSVIGYILLWTVMMLDGGIWSALMIPSAAAICSGFWVFSRLYRVIFLAIKTKNKVEISWRSEIFPFQWRLAVSWVSGYLVLQSFTPIVFARQGAIEAGKVGMTLTIFSALLTLAMSWVGAKLPQMGTHVAKREWKLLDRVFYSAVLRSGVFNIFICICFVIFVSVCGILGVKFVDRICGIPELIFLTLATAFNHITFSIGTFFRAHKAEPTVFINLVLGLMVSTAVYFGSEYGVEYAFGAYALILGVIAVPLYWNVYINFTKMRVAVDE